jgi:hypothetical protein
VLLHIWSWKWPSFSFVASEGGATVHVRHLCTFPLTVPIATCLKISDPLTRYDLGIAAMISINSTAKQLGTLEALAMSPFDALQNYRLNLSRENLDEVQQFIIPFRDSLELDE